MPKQIVKISNISKSFGIKTILKDVSLNILDNDRIGLIGENGSGKTTFCKILLQKEKQDDGSLKIASDIEIGYLPQDIEIFDQDLTVGKYFERFLGSIDLIKKEMRILEKELELKASDETLKKYGKLQEIWERKQIWDLDRRIKIVKQGLEIDYIEQDSFFSTLSGGEKTRITLAALLIFSPDLLILDEPTNHLDFKTLLWLEKYLSDFKKAMVIISHDRAFLNKTINKIVAILSYTHTFSTFYGNYDQYLKESEKLFEKQLKEYERSLEEIKELKRFIKKKSYSAKKPRAPSDNFKAAWDFWGGRAEQSKASQIKAAKVKLQKLEENLISKPLKTALMGFRFYPETIKSDILVKIQNLCISYDDKPLLDKINRDILNGDRIVIVGENGSGKTTFLKLLMGVVRPSSGNIKITKSVKIGYLDQEQKSLNLENTVLEEYGLCRKGDESELREDLHKLGLFTSKEIFLKVKDLSLGQKQKLILAKIIAIKPNMLLLDEPTNHLDLLSLEQLEKALKNFKGAIVAISHDRKFIKKIATDVWHLEGKKFLSENQKQVSQDEVILNSV